MPQMDGDGFGIVQSWNEWDTLREVWVGTLEHKNLNPAREPSVARKLSNYSRYQWPLRDELSDEACLAKAKEQLDNYIDILKKEGIHVKRPAPFSTQDLNIKTPLWSVERMGGFTCPRDLFFVAGKQMIEAPMSWKARYFEHLAWRDLVMTYYNSDPLMRYTCAPKPKLVNTSYYKDGLIMPEEVGNDAKWGKITNDEIFFDAADIRRFGKDAFFQAHYGTANDQGRDWVRRELGASGIRVHDIDFEEFHFSHLDARFTPVDEGLVLYCPMDKPTESTFKLFKENEWNVVDVGIRSDCRNATDACSGGIHMNTLCLGPGVVMVEEKEEKLIKILRDEGCDVITLPFSAAYPFGGGLNCFTLDIYRHGPERKCYFPTLDLQHERETAKAEAAAEARRQKLSEGFVPRAAKRARKA
jgi:glycine amidinotransferase